MSKVKLLSNLQTEHGVIAEGQVIDLPDAEAAKLVSIGAAEATDEAVTATAPAEQPKPEVAPAADPLVTTPVVGEQTPTEANPAIQPTPSPEVQPSSSTNLHLG